MYRNHPTFLKVTVTAAILFIAVWTHHGWARAETDRQEAARDTAALLRLADQFMDQPQRVVVRWSGTVSASVAADLQQKLLQSAKENQESAAASDIERGIKLALPKATILTLAASDPDISGMTRLMAMWESNGEEAGARATLWQEQAVQRLGEWGERGQWVANVQGEAKAHGKLHDAIDAIASETDAKVHDRYKDERSLSVTLETSLFRHNVNVGGSSIGLQAAVHQDTVTDSVRLTLGTPLIVIEY